MLNADHDDPKLDQLLLKQRPHIELALRYAIRDRFRTVAAQPGFNARVEELFGLLARNPEHYAAILRHAREIGEALERELADT